MALGAYVNGGFSLQERTTNDSVRVVAFWQVGVAINVGVIEGILDIVFSAPESFRTGITRGLFGEYQSTFSEIHFICLNEENAGGKNYSWA